MSNKLCISGGGQIKEYVCKTTHTSQPFLNVNSGYLDLTTNSTSGLQLNVKHNNQIYRPVQTTSTTNIRTSTYTKSTFAGKTTVLNNYTTTTAWSGYKSSQNITTYITNITVESGTTTNSLTNGYVKISRQLFTQNLGTLNSYFYHSVVATSLGGSNNGSITIELSNSARLSTMSSRVQGTGARYMQGKTLSVATARPLGYLSMITPATISHSNTYGSFSQVMVARGGQASANFRPVIEDDFQHLTFSVYGSLVRYILSGMNSAYPLWHLEVLNSTTSQMVSEYRTNYNSSSGTILSQSVGYNQSRSYYTTTSTRIYTYSTSSTVSENILSASLSLTSSHTRTSKYSTITEI